MGVLTPGSAHSRPSAQPPIDVSGNFPAHMSAESPLNISPSPSKVISKVPESYDNFLKYPPLSAQHTLFEGVGGVPDGNPNLFVS